MRPSRAPAARRAVLPFAAAVATVALVVTAGGPAGAAVGPVHASPSSGPPGTSFTVSGSGCGPGVTVSGSDYVSVSSTGLPLGVHVPVNSAGSWSTTFNVPNGALPLPALILAACFTDGHPSLTTFYTPATFVVTAAPAPTTAPPPPPPPTTPTTSGSTGTTPTTKGTTGSTKPEGKGSGTGAGDGTSTGAGSGSGSASGAGKSGRARSSGGRSRTGGGPADGSAARTAAERAGAVAGLRSPELASDSHRDSSGISPWWWALLAALVAGAIGTWLWLRRRGTATPDAADDPGSDDASGHGADVDDLDDDWPEFPVLDDEPTITR